MFIRVINYDLKGAEALYQCERVFIHHLIADAPPDLRDRGLAILEMESKEGTVSREIRKADMEVYFMNDAGQTIDSYRWKVNEIGQPKIAA